MDKVETVLNWTTVEAQLVQTPTEMSLHLKSNICIS